MAGGLLQIGGTLRRRATAHRLGAAIACALLVGGCSSEPPEPKSLATVPSLATDSTLPGGRTTSDLLTLTVAASGETAPVLRQGASEDAAIWIDPTDPARSTVIGTDAHGIAVYDLAGRQLQYLPDGQLHNVDIRTDFSLAGTAVALVTAGNRTNNTIAIYAIDPISRLLRNVAARSIQPTVVTFGSCMYHSAVTGAFFYFVTSSDGTVEQWKLFDVGGQVNGQKVRELSVSPGQQLGACVADDQLSLLYVGEKKSGIWRYGAEPGAVDPRVRVDAIGSTGHLAADVEGLTIAYGVGNAGYLIASSEGNNSYAVYERRGINAFVQRFDIRGGRIDGSEDSDGIDVTTANLGPRFPRGLFVAQDRSNDGGNQNFKLVPWGRIVAGR